MKLKALPITILAIVLTVMAASSVFAQEQTCYGPYGEIIPCPVVNKSFSIEKSVIDGDNLVQEYRYKESGSNVSFDVRVENTGELEVDGLVVVDTLPSNLSFVSLKQGNATIQTQVSNGSIKWTINNFAAGDVEKYVMVTKVNADGIAEGNEKCVTNVASMLYKGKNEGSDTAVVCIKKGEVEGAKTTPEVLPDTDLSNIGPVGFALIGLVTGLLLLTASKLAEESVKSKSKE
ncbi:DUF11 domain-containing protein [candidate division WWE3 bacterium]|uniref:DUF11 domain-containing protein n=1 Tax=candidate division WWE3 bacterium TaxID=2053526 RepID=A0A955LKW3_UNCKA|nr:DUF11 domain-containing protein [candidate division WWE3 bacterium]